MSYECERRSTFKLEIYKEEKHEKKIIISTSCGMYDADDDARSAGCGWRRVCNIYWRSKADAGKNRNRNL